MALNLLTIEQLAEWCAVSEAIANLREDARKIFFGYDDKEPVNYLEGVGEVKSLERRFLGWFAFYFQLEDGRHPAELAATAVMDETEVGTIINSIRNARYVTGVVTTIIPGKGFFMELEAEEFEVDSRSLSHILQREQAISIHIFPARHGKWLPAPGWITWPIHFGPGIRSKLKELQIDPIGAERFLQQRGKAADKSQLADQPDDDTLEAAVERMSAAAGKQGISRLILEPKVWQRIVLSYMMANDFNGFVQEIAERRGQFKSEDDANKWLALATNIWNTTPQPDRGGKSATELFRQREKIKQPLRQKSRPLGNMQGYARFKLMRYEMAQAIMNLRNQSLASLEQSWRRDMESKSLPLNITLPTAIKKLPAVWVDGICSCLDIPIEGRLPDRVARIISCLSDDASLAKIIIAMPPKCREAVAYILSQGGWVKYNQLSRKFGGEAGEGWWWNANPPQSVIGQLRLRGLLFVGQTITENRRQKIALIPDELRKPLLKALSARTLLQQAKPPPEKIIDAESYQELGDALREIKLNYAIFATQVNPWKKYYDKFMSYWNKTEDGSFAITHKFGIEEYLWHFKLPGSDRLLLDFFIERMGEIVPQELRLELEKWKSAELKCCRILKADDLLLLEDMYSKERTWGFSVDLESAESFGDLVDNLIVSYVCPKDNNVQYLLGHTALLPLSYTSPKAYQRLKNALRNVTVKTQRYFSRPSKGLTSGLPDIPDVFLKAFEEKND